MPQLNYDELAKIRLSEMTGAEMDDACVKYVAIVNEIIKRRYDQWCDEWKKIVPVDKVLISTLSKNQIAMLDVSPPQRIEQMVTLSIMWGIEVELSMAPVIACRKGIHESCINGQPYDPRYQTPDGAAIKGRTINTNAKGAPDGTES